MKWGRYTRPVTPPPDLRFCSFCSVQSVEDELHFVRICKKYDQDRNKFDDNLDSFIPGYLDKSDEQKFIFLLTSQELDILLPTINFIHNCFMIRKD